MVTQDAIGWAHTHFGGAELGDVRRSKRLVRLVESMMTNTGNSLPKQCPDWADLKGAYRLLSNDAIDPCAIGEPHQTHTRSVCADHPVVLCIQDDTRLRRCDHMLHSTLAVLPGGQLLGILNQYYFQRIVIPKGETPTKHAKRWRESCVWQDATRAVGSAPSGCRFIHVGDRGSDNLDFMEACDEIEGVGFVIRAKNDRRIRHGHDHEADEDQIDRLWLYLQSQTPSCTMVVNIGAQRNAHGKFTRRPRKATVSIRYAAVTLEPPQNHPIKHPPRAVWAVLMHEDDPPKDAEAVDWMLLTSERVDDIDNAKRITGYYTCRWVIEEWHRSLKEGCGIEKSRLDDAEDHLRLISIKSVIAVRLMQLRDLADPSHESASDAESLRSWAPRSWIRVVAKLCGHDESTLTPQEFLLTIAKRGGYLNRKCDPRPGWIVLWRGWYDIAILVEGMELAIALATPP